MVDWDSIDYTNSITTQMNTYFTVDKKTGKLYVKSGILSPMVSDLNTMFNTNRNDLLKTDVTNFGTINLNVVDVAVIYPPTIA